MNNNYEIKNNIEKLSQGYPTKFLDLKMQLELKKKLKKNSYFEFLTYPDCEKVIFYSDIKPSVSLFEIICKNKLEHREILGTINSLGLKDSMYGDIVINDDKYYIYILDEIKDFLINNLKVISRNNIILEERNRNILNNYKRKYLEIEFVSSSERFDSVLSHIIGINRNKVKELAKDKNILVNYDVLNNVSKKMQVGDIFSIRKYGKYRYDGIVKETKSGNLVIKISKYI